MAKVIPVPPKVQYECDGFYESGLVDKAYTEWWNYYGEVAKVMNKWCIRTNFFEKLCAIEQEATVAFLFGFSFHPIEVKYKKLMGQVFKKAASIGCPHVWLEAPGNGGYGESWMAPLQWNPKYSTMEEMLSNLNKGSIYLGCMPDNYEDGYEGVMMVAAYNKQFGTNYVWDISD